MKPRIYAYYHPILSRDQKKEFALANLWKQSWFAKGWEPVLLNRTHASNSTLMSGIIIQGRDPVDVAKDFALCALHAVGCGWMSHYDVINRDFSPTCSDANPPELEETTEHENAGIVFLQTREQIQEILNGGKFLWKAKIVSDSPPDFPDFPLAHCSKKAATIARTHRTNLAFDSLKL